MYVVRMRTKFHLYARCVLRSEEVIFKKIPWGYLLLFKQSACHGNDITREFRLHLWVMWSHYNVLYLLLFIVNNVVYKYDQSLREMDIYILTKFHNCVLFCCCVMGVESEEEEQNFLQVNKKPVNF